VQAQLGLLNTRLSALNVHDAVLRLTEGGCDLVMVYHHERHPMQLDSARYEMRLLGTEMLKPYSKTDAQGRPLYTLPGRAAAPAPFLSYTQNAYLGRMVEAILAEARGSLHLMKRYETDMAEGLKAMASHFCPTARWRPS
jgi:LysR family transcriptional regulator, hypochlorite-specific transcription factor HypT